MASFVDSSDSEEDDNMLSSWLDEQDEEPVVVKKVVIPQKPARPVPKSPYLVDHKDLFYALCELEDFDFEKQSPEQQEALMRTLIVENYNPGDAIIVEGDDGNDMFFVVANEETAETAEVEVVALNPQLGTEVFLTRLRRGKYFGQKFFVARSAVKRGATVRVPFDAQYPVAVSRLTVENFDKWSEFRNLILVKNVPLIQQLPRKERSSIIQNLVIRDFPVDSYIIRKGEKGEDFFIILEGAVKVLGDKGVMLTVLREGHCFGEMSLLTDEPRSADIVAVKNTICFVLSKSVFRTALSDASFNKVLTDATNKIKEIRKKKEESINNMNVTTTSSSAAPAGSSTVKFAAATGGDGQSSETRQAFRRVSSRVVRPFVTTTVEMKKLESGSKVINKYVVERELGRGSFGDVYLCTDQETGAQFAMKSINRPNAGAWNDEAANAIRQEIAVMKRLSHPNIVALREVIDDQNSRKIYLIQEYMEGGPLMPDAESCDPLDISLARKYFRDIVRGVSYLHSEGIIHRDIKPQNMLLSADGTVKIADFGAAVFTGKMKEKVVFGGTPAFMAPELFLSGSGANIDFTKHPGIDVFALGATLYYMVVGRPPWMAKNQIDLATKIKNFELTIPQEITDAHLKHLLKQMLTKDYRTRANLDAVVVDEWVTSEGSEPIFTEKDFIDVAPGCSLSYSEVLEKCATPDALKVVVASSSIVVRAMLHHQIKQILENEEDGRPIVCVGIPDIKMADEFIRDSLRDYPGDNTFDFIFCDCFLHEDALTGSCAAVISQPLVKRIRVDYGYKGKLICLKTASLLLDETKAMGSGDLGMAVAEVQQLVTETDCEMFTAHGLANVIVDRPIGIREMKVLLTEDFSVSDSSVHTHVAQEVTKEEVEHAIIITNPDTDSKLVGDLDEEGLNMLSHLQLSEDRAFTSSPTTPLRSSISTTIDDFAGMQDFETSTLNSTDKDESSSGKTTPKSIGKRSINGDLMGLSSIDLNKMVPETKGLVRKRGFMVVPHGGADTITMVPSPSADPSVMFDRPLKIFSFREEASRRERREVAMRHSRLAQEMREMNRHGDIPTGRLGQGLTSSKSLLHIMNKQHSASKKSFFMEKKSSRGSLPRESPSPSLSSRSKSHSSLGSDVDKISKHVDGDASHTGRSISSNPNVNFLLNVRSDNFEEELQVKQVADAFESSDEEDDDDDDDNNENNQDDDDDSDEDDEIDNEEIYGLDGDAFDLEFAQFTPKKTEGQEALDIQEWNHIIVGAELAHKLTTADDETAFNEGMGIKFAKHCDKVCRTYMEDRSYASALEENSLPTHPVALFAVFDGHSGDYVAAHLQAEYSKTFTEVMRERFAATGSTSTAVSSPSSQATSPKGNNQRNDRYLSFEAKMEKVFEETTRRMDRFILEKDYRRQQTNIRNGIMDMQTYGGSVAVVAAVIPFAQSMQSVYNINSGVEVFVSHVGDCRAVLSRDGQAIQLTEDHKPNSRSERTRIEAAGGWVQNGRVNGGIAVSRSFGDIQFKNFSHCAGFVGDESCSKGIWGPHQAVISRPDFYHFVVDNSSYEFMILASDGLWDVFPSQDAVNFVRKRLVIDPNLDHAAKELVEKAIKRGTQDNTSVVIVAFNQ